MSSVAGIPIVGQMFQVLNFHTVVAIKCNSGKCTDKGVILLLGGAFPTTCPVCGNTYQCRKLDWDIEQPAQSQVAVYVIPKPEGVV